MGIIVLWAIYSFILFLGNMIGYVANGTIAEIMGRPSKMAMLIILDVIVAFGLLTVM